MFLKQTFTEHLFLLLGIVHDIASIFDSNYRKKNISCENEIIAH